MIKNASYLKKCMKEALRLNPLSVGIGRVLTEDLILSGYLVPEGVWNE
jgi:ecdysteroid 25-hydroxylase CYP302A1